MRRNFVQFMGRSLFFRFETRQLIYVQSNSISRKSVVCYQRRKKSDLTRDMGEKSFWDTYYSSREAEDVTSGNSFEWFFPYLEAQEVFQSVFESVAQPQKACKGAIHVAELGCGTSELARELVKVHSCHVTCIDFSLTALGQSQRNAQFAAAFHAKLSSHLAFVAADVCHLPFKKNSFDVVYEKGTMDALLKSENSRQKSGLLLSETLRVLKPGGIFLQFSDEAPELRLDLLEEVERQMRRKSEACFSISFQTVGQSTALEYFAYKIKNGSSLL